MQTLEVHSMLQQSVKQVGVLGNNDKSPAALSQSLQYIPILVEDDSLHLVILHCLKEL